MFGAGSPGSVDGSFEHAEMPQASASLKGSAMKIASQKSMNTPDLLIQASHQSPQIYLAELSKYLPWAVRCTLLKDPLVHLHQA